ncbi:MAG: Holliday junction resolvase RuvX [Acidimicrobiaceae bacterium]|nr:Holliday junction resolvase RuvX [Acidimicrobiaceae bacterium]
MRALGLDLGSRRVGVAICGSDARVAVPMTTLLRNPRNSAGDRKTDFISEIAKLVRDRKIDVVVVGLPLSLSGRAGSAAAGARSVIRQLRRSVGVPIVAWDERLTTASAERILMSRGLPSVKRRKVVDQLAATVILQAWLEAGMPMTGQAVAE